MFPALRPSQGSVALGQKPPTGVHFRGAQALPGVLCESRLGYVSCANSVAGRRGRSQADTSVGRFAGHSVARPVPLCSGESTVYTLGSSECSLDRNRWSVAGDYVGDLA